MPDDSADVDDMGYKYYDRSIHRCADIVRGKTGLSVVLDDRPEVFARAIHTCLCNTGDFFRPAHKRTIYPGRELHYEPAVIIMEDGPYRRPSIQTVHEKIESKKHHYCTFSDYLRSMPIS